MGLIPDATDHLHRSERYKFVIDWDTMRGQVMKHHHNIRMDRWMYKEETSLTCGG